MKALLFVLCVLLRLFTAIWMFYSVYTALGLGQWDVAATLAAWAIMGDRGGDWLVERWGV